MFSSLLPKPKHTKYETIPVILPRKTVSKVLAAPRSTLTEIVYDTNKTELHLNSDGTLNHAKTNAANAALNIVQTSYADTIPLKVRYPNLKHHFPRYTLQTCPDDSLATCLEETRELINKILAKNEGVEESQDTVVNYTPNSLDPENERGRTIEIRTYQEDPMLPPKHKLRKNREKAPSPPPPVLKAAPKAKVTKEIKDKWHIPSAVSNWKNNMGYAISLDKRVKAASGGSAGEGVTVNMEKLSSLSQALSEADQQAREEIRIRNEHRKEEALREQQEKEKQLQKLVETSRRRNPGKRSADHLDGRNTKYRRS